MVKELKNLDDYEKVINSGKLVVIFFTAIWCPSCQPIKPKFDALAKNKNHSAVTFCSIDVDANDQAADKSSIGCMPTFQLYKNGSKVDTLEVADRMKAADYDALVAKINKHKIQIRDKSATQPNQASLGNKYPPEMFHVNLDTKKWIHLFFNLQMQGWWPFIDFDIKMLSITPGMFVQEKLEDRHGGIKDLVISKDPELEKDQLIQDQRPLKVIMGEVGDDDPNKAPKIYLYYNYMPTLKDNILCAKSL